MGVLFARAPYPVPVVKPRGRLVLVGRGLGFYPIPSADPGLSVCAVAEVRAAARTALTAASAIPVTHRASALLRLRVSDFAPEALSALGGWSPRKKEPKKRKGSRERGGGRCCHSTLANTTLGALGVRLVAARGAALFCSRRLCRFSENTALDLRLHQRGSHTYTCRRAWAAAAALRAPSSSPRSCC